MVAKQAGKCPFCKSSIEAIVVEENTIRRDKCRCPNCSETLFVCRSPGCHDYAKGTETYDHELCPECTSSAASAGAEVGKATLKVGGTVGAALLISAFKK